MTTRDRGHRAPTLAIVGGGFSGTLLAVHLLRRAGRPLRIVMFEREGAAGRGVAYGTTLHSHLLNVRSSGMSAFPERPDHFAEWARGPGALPESVPADFLPRSLYGGYLEAVLREARTAAPSGGTLETLAGSVVDVEARGDGVVVRLADGSACEARAAVLALGNLPGKGPFSGDALPGYHGNPWRRDALEGLAPGDPLLVIGTGLTMVDLLLSLREGGHRGVVHALSRRGLLPLAHVPGKPAPPIPADSSAAAPTVRGWLRSIRRSARDHGDWRLVVDGLRPHASSLWRAFPPEERARFLRHVRPYWDVHRHRMAPTVARAVESAVREGSLVVRAGRILGLVPSAAGLRARYVPRGGAGEVALEVARVINATGPETDASRIDDPLVRTLLARGTVRRDAHLLGLDATPRGSLIDADGRESGVLFTLGPLLRGVLWECTAVPEIRLQARDLASTLLDSLEGPGG